MTYEPLSDHFLHHLEPSPASPASSPPPVPSATSPVPASPPLELFLSEVPDTPLEWLWPGRLPLGNLTLLDAAPGSDPSLLALTLAACVSSGTPLPGGTPTPPANVLLFAPYDSASATLKPRLQAAGGDPSRVLLFRPPLTVPSHTQSRAHSFALSCILDHLSRTIRRLKARLLIFDPASAIPGLVRCLPALSDLAQQTNCAILLIRSLRQPPANLLRASSLTVPLQEAIRSRLLLTPDPADERQHLLLTTWHPLSPQPAPPSLLSYDLLFSEQGIPAIHWLPQQDPTRLARLSTAPLHSPHRQAILRFLHSSPVPQSIPAILAATSYDPEAGRKMLIRMKLAGELVSPARGLYTTATHPTFTTTSDAPAPAAPDTTTTPDSPSFPVPNVTSPLPSAQEGFLPGTDSSPVILSACSAALNPVLERSKGAVKGKNPHSPEESLKTTRGFFAEFLLERRSRSPERSEGEGLSMTGEESG